ncbi:MAG TPA: hypothetical protein VF006_28495 [Longimicrobium sp.]
MESIRDNAEAQRFTLLRDVLRKRRARAAARVGWTRTRSDDPDARPPAQGPGPSAPDPETTGGTESGTHGWERYFRESGIRIETQVPARELTPKQARAAGARMVPALAALSARTGGTDQPVPLALEEPGGTVIFLPPTLDAEASAGWETFRAALRIQPRTPGPMK